MKRRNSFFIGGRVMLLAALCCVLGVGVCGCESFVVLPSTRTYLGFRSVSSASGRSHHRRIQSLVSLAKANRGSSSDEGKQNTESPGGRKSSSSPAVKNGVRQISPLSSAKRAASASKKAITKVLPRPTRKYELLQHEILSKEEEQKLGKQLRRAIQVKARIEKLQETKELKHLERLEERRQKEDDLLRQRQDHDGFSLEDELEQFLMRSRKSYSRTRSGHYIKNYYGYNQEEELFEFDDMVEEEEMLGFSVYGMERKNSLQDFDSRSVVTQGANSLDIVDITLSEIEIVQELGIDGRKELSRILVEGAMAKEKIISSNIRLVMSIAKKWMSRTNTAQRYNALGSWTTPSLDEVVQEGILGLAKAADRFEPERNLKFSTYATYYITNEVRRCFQGATTGCLRVTPSYYGIRIKYQKLVKQHYVRTGQAMDIEVAARKLNLDLQRLRFILKTTEPLLQLDGRISGMAGSNTQQVGSIITFAEVVECMEPSPETVVERSLLRQCLENALAAELSPHERDVIRLLYGLDDGIARTVKEVVESCGGMLSQGDIRKAENRAYSKLRVPRSVHNQRLMGFAAEFVSFDPLEILET